MSRNISMKVSTYLVLALSPDCGYIACSMITMNCFNSTFPLQSSNPLFILLRSSGDKSLVSSSLSCRSISSDSFVYTSVIMVKSISNPLQQPNQSKMHSKHPEYPILDSLSYHSPLNSPYHSPLNSLPCHPPTPSCHSSPIHIDQSKYCEKLLRLYQFENAQIQQRNFQLLEAVRQVKLKENNLHAEIRELELLHRKLIEKARNEDIQDYEPTLISQYDYQPTLINQQNYQPPSIDHQPTLNAEYDLIKLKEEFAQLVEASINEEDPRQRRKLRKDLGSLAHKMKKLEMKRGYSGIKSRRILREQNENKPPNQELLDSYLFSAKKKNKGRID